ncbi:hypothetical protein PVK06_023731 [Gossypium arboreum]|uniref:DUF4283 domain-containing protein n=1 Tax=Gossypium arboreum TaxID=29729 RepID=A0ABR0PC50_GOSAR|nr:hypothetical protein PVK06_023731 [Gossypium arboreum]
MENAMKGLNINNEEDEVWQIQARVKISDLREKRYLFRFYNRVDNDQVVNGAPWMFNNHLLVFQNMERSEDPIERYGMGYFIMGSDNEGGYGAEYLAEGGCSDALMVAEESMQTLLLELSMVAIGQADWQQ